MSDDDESAVYLLNRPKRPQDLTTLALYELEWGWYKSLPVYVIECTVNIPVADTARRNLGSEVVKIECRYPELDENDRLMATAWARRLSRVFTLHKSLLCRYSRYFKEILGRPDDEAILADALMEIERREEPYLTYEGGPAGYVPSHVTFVEDYRRQAREPSPPAEANQQHLEDVLIQTNEFTHHFGIFVHWLYTGELELDDIWTRESDAVVCARIYGLAERLDVPGLRHACYDTLRDLYNDADALPDTLPNEKVIEVIINNCTPTSLLRKYMVAKIAHEVIAGTKESKELCDPLLDLDKCFATEVALEVMNRLRSGEGSTPPNKDEQYEIEDSDSDVCSSVDTSSDIYYSDEDMSISAGEDEESVVGETPEGPSTAVKTPQPAAELSSLDSVQKSSVATSGPSTTTGRLPGVKIEGDSRADHALLDVNANKRKRASHSFGDDENPRTKRSETQIEDDIECVDLTKSSQQ